MYLCAYVVQLRQTVIFFLLILGLISCGNKDLLQEVKQLPHYPSTSGIEYINNKIYIIGDDANNLLVLDSNLNTIDSILL